MLGEPVPRGFWGSRFPELTPTDFSELRHVSQVGLLGLRILVVLPRIQVTRIVAVLRPVFICLGRYFVRAILVTILARILAQSWLFRISVNS